jgi:hypothetical protein
VAVLTASRAPQLTASTVRAALTQVVLVVAGVMAYFGMRGVTESDAATAVDHAHDLMALQRALGLAHEQQLQALIVDSHAAVAVVNWIYIWGHWPVIAVVLAWLLVMHPDGFRLLRDAVLVSGLIGVVIFVAYPVAPPRLADVGLVDTITEYSRSYRVLQPPAFVNKYAAVPSLHVGWDLLMGIAVVRYARRPAVRAVGVLMPVAMVVAVVLTGNHYVLDAVAGAAVALTGLAVAAWWRRRADDRTGQVASPTSRGPTAATRADTTVPPPRLPRPRPSDEDAGAPRRVGADAGAPRRTDDDVGAPCP